MAYDPNDHAAAARLLIGQLRRSGLPEAEQVADILEGCRKSRPCYSAACRYCGLTFQEVGLSVVELFIRVPARTIRSRMNATTIVPAEGCVAPDDLTAEVFRCVRRRITEALEAGNVPSSIVGIEASFNEDLTGEIEPHWCVHGHGIGMDWLSDSQDETLRRFFPPSALSRGPVHSQPLDQQTKGRRYPFKPQRFRRVRYRIDAPANGRSSFITTRRRWLRPWQAVKLAIVEHQVGFDARLLTHGIDADAFEQHLRNLNWPRDGP